MDGRALFRQKDCCGRVTRQFCLILADLVLSRSASSKMPRYRPDQATCGRQGSFPPNQLLWPSHQAVLFDTRRPCVIKVGKSENALISAGSSILWTAGHFPAKKVAVAQLTSSFVWYFQTLCDRGKSDRICPDLRRLKQLIVGGNIFFNFLRNSCFILLVFQNDFTKFYFSFAFILAFPIFFKRGSSFLTLSSWFFLQHYTSGWSPSNLQKIRGLWFLRALSKNKDKSF